MANSSNLHIFSFFSGSGFLDLGFEESGFTIDLVNEFSPAFLNAYNRKSAQYFDIDAYARNIIEKKEICRCYLDKRR